MEAVCAQSIESAGAESGSTVNPWLIAAAVILPTFMEILDTTIVSVALPNIAGNLSVANSEATWVQTSYLVANAIVLPASAWFSSFFGRKNFFLSCITLFTIASFICGIAPSLEILVLARIMQGASGGALQPISQAILLESFPPAKHGVAMAAYALGVIIAPVVGPVLGGWLTDNWSWRWDFFINIPVGIAAVFLVSQFVRDPAYIKNAKPGKIDSFGFGLLALWLGTLQIVLDKGQDADWFNASWICWFSIVSMAACMGFIFWQLKCKEPIANLRVFSNRNFWVGTLLAAIAAVFMYAPLTLLPMFLQGLMGYTAFQSGLAQIYMGVGSAIGMPLVGIFMNKIDSRCFVAAGFAFMAIACWMLGHLCPVFPKEYIYLPTALLGLGIGLCLVPLMAVSVGLLKKEQMGNAAGLFALARNQAGSIGISAVTAFVTRFAIIHQAEMVHTITPYEPRYQLAANALQTGLTTAAGAAQAAPMANELLYQSMQFQGAVLAYLDVFTNLAFVCVLAIPLVFLLKRVKTEGTVAMH